MLFSPHPLLLPAMFLLPSKVSFSRSFLSFVTNSIPVYFKIVDQKRRHVVGHREGRRERMFAYRHRKDPLGKGKSVSQSAEAGTSQEDMGVLSEEGQWEGSGQESRGQARTVGRGQLTEGLECRAKRTFCFKVVDNSLGQMPWPDQAHHLQGLIWIKGGLEKRDC